MFGHRHHKHKHNPELPADVTPGQGIDLIDFAVDTGKLLGGAQNPLRSRDGSFSPMPTLAAGLFDIGLSSAMAPRGKMLASSSGAVAAQTSALSAWFVGNAVGSVVGNMVLPGIGGKIGGLLGGSAFSFATDKIARTAAYNLVNDTINSSPQHIRFGKFKDSERAYTMRQRSEQELQGSLVGARRWLGREAFLMHQ